MTFDEYIGLQHSELEGGSTATVEIEPHHCNPTGNINGGVIISLADNIATGAAGRGFFEKFGEHKFMVGVDLHATMLSNQIGGRIRGEARPVRVGRRVTFVKTQVFGDDDKLLAEITTTHVPT
ncbi:MAG: hotdog fold thioesterase [Pseudomonadales bacterium]|nr:hotdog fold thioesterase [Pseudomonadales bacterium]